ncbi:MAG TPA: DUF4175 family protein [Verrucomicrobiae bacterium]|nr:DUF4175 family protein [Verrucomicrobiae bacterium]
MLTENSNILNRLGAADRVHQRETAGRFLLRCVKYVCGFVLAAFVLDVVLHLPAGWRLGLLLTLIAGALCLLCVAAYLAFIRRNRLEHIARFLESRDATLGSQLINLLQLRDQSTDTTLSPFTRELAQQAVDNYAGQLRATPLERMAWTGDLRRYFWRAAWVVLGFAALLAAFFRVSVVEFARFADPYGDHPPYSFTRLEIVEPAPTGTNVIYGGSVLVRVKSGGHPPREVFLTSHPPGQPDQAVTVPMFDKGRSGFDQRLDNLRQELVVYAHTKDRVSLSKQARIGLILTPQVEKVAVTIAPPAYTGLKPEEKPYLFKPLQALTGSELRFRLQSNRPLRGGELTITVADQPDQRVALTNTAENEVAGAFIARESARLRFAVTDITGIPSASEHEGALTVTYDLPPAVRVDEPARDCFVAMDFKLQARFEASDDYGLRAVRIHRGLNGVYSPPHVVTYDTVVRNASETVDLKLADLGVQPGDIISLFAEAVDTSPQAQLARSQTVRLMVISVEDYNNFLREQTDLADAEAKYRSLMDDVQALIDEQKKLGENAERLRDQLANADAKQQEALLRSFDALVAAQNELNRKLNQQAERMETFVRENPLYDVEKELQEQLQEQAKNIRESTRTNDTAARDLAARSSPTEGPRQLSADMAGALKKESDDQVARLDRVQAATEEQVADVLAEMSQMQELLKDFNLFEALYQAQQELTAQAQAYNRPGELSRQDQLALKELAATQKEVGEALEQLEQKLRDDAAAARELFPQAAKSAEDLAGQISKLRLAPLARQATGRMLAGEGEPSYQSAERLRSEMEKLFADCQGGNCPSSNELDTYLRLQRSMNPGNNFSQMSRSRKLGIGRNKGFGFASGQGEGSGSSGYAVQDSSKLDVMGNEFAPSRGSATGRQPSRLGRGTGGLPGGTTASELDKPDVVTGLNPVNRQSGTVVSEALIEEYSAVVEGYFKAITTRNPSAP